MATVSYPWYGLASGPRLEQGDILRDCLVPVLPRLVEPTAAGAPPQKPEEVLSHDRVIVLSQSCDLADGNIPRVMLCPAYPLDGFLKVYVPGGKKADVNNTKGNLKRGRLTAHHLLNECDISGHEFQHLVVDFGDAFSVEFADVKELTSSGDRVRLLPPYREHLAQLFARFYMRVGLPVEVASMA